MPLKVQLPLPSIGSELYKLGVQIRAKKNREHQLKGKYHCKAELLFDLFGFDQTSKTVIHSTLAKQLNPNKINRRSAIHLHSP